MSIEKFIKDNANLKFRDFTTLVNSEIEFKKMFEVSKKFPNVIIYVCSWCRYWDEILRGIAHFGYVEYVFICNGKIYKSDQTGPNIKAPSNV